MSTPQTYDEYIASGGTYPNVSPVGATITPNHGLYVIVVGLPDGVSISAYDSGDIKGTSAGLFVYDSTLIGSNMFQVDLTDGTHLRGTLSVSSNDADYTAGDPIPQPVVPPTIPNLYLIVQNSITVDDISLSLSIPDNTGPLFFQWYSELRTSNSTATTLFVDNNKINNTDNLISGATTQDLFYTFPDNNVYDIGCLIYDNTDTLVSQTPIKIVQAHAPLAEGGDLNQTDIDNIVLAVRQDLDTNSLALQSLLSNLLIASNNTDTVKNSVNSLQSVVNNVQTSSVKNTDLVPIAKTAELALLAKTSDLTPLAKTADLASIGLGDLSLLAKTTDLDAVVKRTDIVPLAKTSDLTPLAKTSDLGSVLGKLDQALTAITNLPTPQSIASAVSELAIEDQENLLQTLRLLRAVLAGDSQSGVSPQFKRKDGTTVALTITTSSSGRVNSTPGNLD